MAEYRIIGLDRETGEERDLTLTANSEDEAVRKAGDLRVVVERCVEQSQPTSPRSAPPPLPHGQTERPRSSAGTGLGIAGLVIGIVAVLGAWVPVVGLLSFPVAFLGGVLALIGLIIALSSRAKDYAFPLAGVITCIVAGVVSITSTAGVGAAVWQANEAKGNETTSADAGNSQDPTASGDSVANPNGGDSRARAILSRFEVMSARFYWSEGRFTNEPVIELKVRNRTDTPVSRAYFDAEVRSPGRSISWVADRFNYEIPGGLEPGETATWNLAPNQFSDWGNVPKDRDDLQLHAEVYALDGPDGETFAEVDMKP